MAARQLPGMRLRHLPVARQRRFGILMARNSAGRLTKAQRAERAALVREAEEIALRNARLLAGERTRLREA
jgi:hypothetical protein